MIYFRKEGVYMIYSMLDLKQIIRRVIKKYNVKEAILFGSYARNQANDNSDIDLIIIGDKTFDSTDIFSIAEELYEVSGKRVDVFEINEITKGTPLYEAVLKEGIVLVEDLTIKQLLPKYIEA